MRNHTETRESVSPTNAPAKERDAPNFKIIKSSTEQETEIRLANFPHFLQPRGLAQTV